MNLHDANKRLPLVRAVIKDAMERWAELRELRARLAALEAEGPPAERLAALLAEKERAEDELRGYLCEIEELGAEVKDLEIGLVDFPARAGSRTVYLCWKAGEPEIGFWHEIDAGFAGRRPIDELP
jgi:hypothetical protein